MIEFQTIPNPPDEKVLSISYSPAYSAICSVSDIPFSGRLYIEYKPSDKLIEFESFEKGLAEAMKSASFTIEDVARLVFDSLERVLGDIPMCVTIRARTTVHAPVSAQIKNRWEE